MSKTCLLFAVLSLLPSVAVASLMIYLHWGDQPPADRNPTALLSIQF